MSCDGPSGIAAARYGDGGQVAAGSSAGPANESSVTLRAYHWWIPEASLKARKKSIRLILLVQEDAPRFERKKKQRLQF